MQKLICCFSALVLFTFLAGTVSAWEYREDKDEFEGTVFRYILGEPVKPNEPLPWPHSDPVVYLYFQCSDRLFVLRNSANNLNGVIIEDGYNRYYFRAKFDTGGIFKIPARNKWGSEYFLLNERFLFSRFSQHGAKSLLIELDHFSFGKRHYTFDLTSFDPSLCPNI